MRSPWAMSSRDEEQIETEEGEGWDEEEIGRPYVEVR
jgi:hypothetical protein